MIHSELFNSIPNLEHGFSTKQTDAGLMEKLWDEVSRPKQIHGNKIIWPKEKEVTQTEADAIFCDRQFFPVGVVSADCCPILVAAVNENGSAFAVMAIHAGWRGTAQNIASLSVESLLSNNFIASKCARLLAVIGPCISQKFFEVGEEVIAALPSAPCKPAVQGAEGEKKYFIDIARENQSQLEKSSQLFNTPMDLEILNYCSFEREDLFPSYRRDGAKSGRILSYISLLESDKA